MRELNMLEIECISGGADTYPIFPSSQNVTVTIGGPGFSVSGSPNDVKAFVGQFIFQTSPMGMMYNIYQTGRTSGWW